jgi:hypothetical protein
MIESLGQAQQELGPLASGSKQKGRAKQLALPYSRLTFFGIGLIILIFGTSVVGLFKETQWAKEFSWLYCLHHYLYF